MGKLLYIILNLPYNMVMTMQAADQQLEGDVGPLASILPCSESRILDHMIVMKAFDYSITDIANMSGVGIKTTLRIVHRLESDGVLLRTRNVGRAIMFKINPDSERAKTLEKLSFQVAHERAMDAIREQ